ncbi:MAG: hypothetical protein QF921_11825 [Pseudomonadales bacterium]|nr:hypothetical protein [Pseudomonadales bacterium]MDP6470545.1 hypothetical protein [Pseudomonadales bacterium]MDP6827847.1 hypothetical protein [Pseudomonadales bacterium]MDP6972179.1 hypothetical protein [Pseudomonadales bacterium]
MRSAETLSGFVACVRGCGELLARVAPASVEKNELPNHLVVLE